jgi:ABC-type sugar transport system ATPase subunit
MPDLNMLLEMRNIQKTFPRIKALNDADFAAEEGEIHALASGNNSGKSTLAHILVDVPRFFIVMCYTGQYLLCVFW